MGLPSEGNAQYGKKVITSVKNDPLRTYYWAILFKEVTVWKFSKSLNEVMKFRTISSP